MNPTHDIYSETNPAFYAFGVCAFTTAYLSLKSEGPELPSVYLALPVAFSGDLEATFKGTNRNTGLLEWWERSPEVQIDIASRINRTLDHVSEGIRLGCFSGAIALHDSGRLGLGKLQLKRRATKSLSDEPAKALKRAERLGFWFASAGSTRAVFDIMGLSV